MRNITGKTISGGVIGGRCFPAVSRDSQRSEKPNETSLGKIREEYFVVTSPLLTNPSDAKIFTCFSQAREYALGLSTCTIEYLSDE